MLEDISYLFQIKFYFESVIMYLLVLLDCLILSFGQKFVDQITAIYELRSFNSNLMVIYLTIFPAVTEELVTISGGSRGGGGGAGGPPPPPLRKKIM